MSSCRQTRQLSWALVVAMLMGAGFSPAARAVDVAPPELQVRISQASRALSDCTVAAVRSADPGLDIEAIDRFVISKCVDSHGALVELTYGLATPLASRILLLSTIEALERARRARAD